MSSLGLPFYVRCLPSLLRLLTLGADHSRASRHLPLATLAVLVEDVCGVDVIDWPSYGDGEIAVEGGSASANCDFSMDSGTTSSNVIEEDRLAMATKRIFGLDSGCGIVRVFHGSGCEAARSIGGPVHGAMQWSGAQGQEAVK
ncbi:unnamed protein product [Prunus armeniaca]